MPVALVALYRGSEGRRRVFDVLVDGTPIATETLPYHPRNGWSGSIRSPKRSREASSA